MINLKDIESFYPENVRGFKRSILREYLQYKILEIIFKTKTSEKLSFIGGTCLRLIHGTSRFSEDLDFDNFNLDFDEFLKLSEIIKKELDFEGFDVEIKNTRLEAFRCLIRFPKLLYDNELSSHANEKILIKVDTQAQGFDYNPEATTINKFEITAKIKVTPVDILLSQKINAIFGRKRKMGRDFYDVIFLSSKTKPNYDFLEAKLNIDNPKKLKNELISLTKSLDISQLVSDVKPLVLKLEDAEKIKFFNEIIEKVDWNK